MKRITIFIFGTICAFILAGCAGFETFTRSERASYVPLEISQVQLSPDLSNMIQIRCFDWKGKVVSPTTNTVTSVQKNGGQPKAISDADEACLYYSADVSGALADPYLGLKAEYDAGDTNYEIHAQHRRNLLAHFLIKISDDNCSTFLNRAAANKLVGDAAISVFRDFLTAGSGVAAQINPISATTLAAGNLVAGSYDKSEAAVYANEAFSAVESSILSLRAQKRVEIETSLTNSYASYDIYKLLDDIRSYDEMCSIRQGLANLQAVAKADATMSQTNLTAKLLGLEAK